VLLPSFVAPEEQRELVRWSLHDQARHPNDTNLDIHFTLPQCGLWHAHLSARQNAGADILIQPRVTIPEGAIDSSGPRKLIDNTPASPDNFYLLSASSKNPATPSPTAQASPPSALLPKLRWANIGWTYHWGSKQYDFSRGKGEVHPRLRELCKSIVRSVDWGQALKSDDGSDTWGGGSQDWMTWGDTYGTCSVHQNHPYNIDLLHTRARCRHRKFLPDQSEHALQRVFKPMPQRTPRLFTGHTHGTRRPLRSLRYIPTSLDIVCTHPHDLDA
jgi:hypothetical protein